MGNVLVCLILLLIVAGIISYLVKERKKGHLSCGCDCGNCSAHCSRRQ